MLDGVRDGVHLLDGRLHELAAVLRHLRRDLDVAADGVHRIEGLADALGKGVDLLLRLGHIVHLLLRGASDLRDGLRDALRRLGGLLRRLGELARRLADDVGGFLDFLRHIADIVKHVVERDGDVAELVGAIHRDAVGEVARLALLGALEDGVDAGFDFPHEIEHDADGDEEDEHEHDDRRRADARVGRIGLVSNLSI